MYSIEVLEERGGWDVSLLKDGEYVNGGSTWHKTPVEVAFRVRELVEKYL